MFLKTINLAAAFITAFSSMSLAQEKLSIEQLNTKIENLNSQINGLQATVHKLEDRIPYYEGVLQLQQSEPKIKLKTYEVNLNEVQFDAKTNNIVVNGIIKQHTATTGYRPIQVYDIHIITPEGRIITADFAMNGTTRLFVNKPEIDIPYSFTMRFPLEAKIPKLAMLKFEIGSGSAKDAFVFKGLTVE